MQGLLCQDTSTENQALGYYVWKKLTEKEPPGLSCQEKPIGNEAPGLLCQEETNTK